LGRIRNHDSIFRCCSFLECSTRKSPNTARQEKLHAILKSTTDGHFVPVIGCREYHLLSLGFPALARIKSADFAGFIATESR
jgi:hypothetical protein